LDNFGKSIDIFINGKSNETNNDTRSFPSNTGSFSTNVSVTSNGGNQNVYVHGVVPTPNPSLFVSTTDIDLGTQDPGVNFETTFTVQNTGGGTLTGDITENISWITSISPPSFSLGANQFKTITMQGIFPSNPGSFSDSVYYLWCTPFIGQLLP